MLKKKLCIGTAQFGTDYGITNLVGRIQIEEVKELISKPPTEKQIKAMKEARELVLFKYNIWPSINRIVRGDTKPF